MNEKSPLIVRLILTIDRAFAAIGRMGVITRDEALWAWTSQASRERANRAIYGALKTYAPGGATFEGGLFDWEREAISATFPPSGRILLGAAGGGRELLALAKMNYEVIAFEPSSSLAEAASVSAARFPTCQVIVGSFADLMLAAEAGSGALAPMVCNAKFDAVVLGWTSFSYVWRADRERLLKSLRAIAPHAPVLLSYLAPGAPVQGVAASARKVFRQFLRVTGAACLAEPGDAFLPWSGFYQTLTPAEIHSLAPRCGYRVALESSVENFAVLAPTANF